MVSEIKSNDDLTLSSAATKDVKIKSRNTSYTWPTADGTADSFLQTNGSGTLSWGEVSAANGFEEVANGTKFQGTGVGSNIQFNNVFTRGNNYRIYINSLAPVTATGSTSLYFQFTKGGSVVNSDQVNTACNYRFQEMDAYGSNNSGQRNSAQFELGGYFTNWVSKADNTSYYSNYFESLPGIGAWGWIDVFIPDGGSGTDAPAMLTWDYTKASGYYHPQYGYNYRVAGKYTGSGVLQASQSGTNWTTYYSSSVGIDGFKLSFSNGNGFGTYSACKIFKYSQPQLGTS